MRGKIRLHYGLQRCNAQRADLACVGEGSRDACCRLSGILPPIVGMPAADCREYCCRLSGCLLPFGGMPGMSRADALHYIRTGIGTKQRRHRNKVWKALARPVGQ